MADLDRWIEIAKECKYLPENDLKVSYIRDIALLFAAISQLLFLVYFRNYVTTFANYFLKNQMSNRFQLLSLFAETFMVRLAAINLFVYTR